jgi:hypothetical protein
MDESLNERYLALFDGYNVVDRPLVARVKKRLSERINRSVSPSPREKEPLRSDAALLLLTLMDDMIIRPYFTPMISVNRPRGIPIPAVVAAITLDRLPSFLDNLLEIIFNKLHKSEEDPAFSSHDVIEAINGAWKDLSAQLGWG